MKIANRQKSAGFTLIELMITVAIIAILAGIVVPNYSDYVRRSALSEAFANLSDLRVKMDQFYQNNRSYGNNAQTTPCGHDGTANRISFALGGKFNYSCTLTGTSPNENQAYRLTATGSSGAASDHVYTLDSDNLKRTTKFKGTNMTKTCWLVKGTEC